MDQLNFRQARSRGVAPASSWGCECSRHHRQQHAAGRCPAAIDAFRHRLVVLRLGIEDVVDIGLRIAVVEREQARLDLHHDFVAGQENVIDIGQAELVFLDLAGSQRRGLSKPCDVAAAEDLDADRQFEPGHAGL